MPDWYDRLLTRLGLDSVRNDQLLGVPLREFTPLEFSNSPGVLKPSLCSLPDGRTQIVFQVAASGDRWVGFLPCSTENLRRLEEFLERAQSPGIGTVEPRREMTFARRMLRPFCPARVLVAITPLPDRHLESTVEWCLVADSEEAQRLQFTIRGPRGLFRREPESTPEITARLVEITAEARKQLSVWGEPKSPTP